MAITQQKALSKVFGDPQKKVLRKLEKRVGAINALAKKYENNFFIKLIFHLFGKLDFGIFSYFI